MKNSVRKCTKQKSAKADNRQQTLNSYEITGKKQCKEQTKKNISTSFQKQLQFDTALTDNYHFGDKFNKLKESNLRIFYLNINGLESDLNKLAQLCLTLCSMGISLICINEKNCTGKQFTYYNDSKTN